MNRLHRSRPFVQRLFSGLASGIIVGMLLGLGISVWLIHVNVSPHTPFLKGELRLHLAAIYAALLIVPGLLVGIFATGRRSKANMIEHAMVILLALALFYYGRNKLSLHLWSHGDSLRWPLEILGAIGWGVVCWLFYRMLLAIVSRIRGWLLGVSVACIVLLSAVSAYNIVHVPSAHGAVAKKPILPAPKDNVKVALIGIDGAWWDIMNPLLEAGRLPSFQQLIERGTRADLQTIRPTQSPLIWTTIATGKMPSKHCITSFRIWTFPITHESVPLTKVPGSFPELIWMTGGIIRQTPINSTFRMSEAVWNMLTEAGLSVGVLNWWASYPAEPVNGYVVSDHALYNKALNVVIGEKPREDPRSVFPPQLLPDLEPLMVDPDSVSRDSVARFIHFQSDEDWNHYLAINDYRIFDQDAEAAMFKFSYPEDVTMVRASLYLLKHRPQPDFFAVYLDGMDSMQHKYLSYFFHQENKNLLRADNIARFKDLVTEYYVYMDQVLGQLLAAMDSSTTVIVVSDHGFDRGIRMPDRIYDHQNAPPGVFIMAGDNIKQGVTLEDVSVKDITPTILAMFGLPIGRDMDGRILTDAFKRDDSPMTWVDTYDTADKARGRIEPSEIDKNIIDKLRALGYFK